MVQVEMKRSRGSDFAPVRRRTLQDRGDIWLVVGALCGGSFVFGPLGLVALGYAAVLYRRAQRAGEAIRPWAVTIMAVFCLVDAGVNCVGWAIDLFAHDTVAAKTMLGGYGKLFDAGYYLDYNSLPIGGTAAAGEKGWEVVAVLVIFPMRIAAAWGFLQMKRWGLQFMVVTSYLYVVLLVGYWVNMTVYFDDRIGGTLWGVIGYWGFNLAYLTPWIMLPYLHTVNREQFAN